MPFRTPRTTSSGEQIHFYNIDYAIGCTGWNHRVDVKLVQALLQLYFYELTGVNEGGDPPSGYESLVVDGYCGPVTRLHLMHYQQQAHKRGHPVLLDGRFDPFHGGMSRSSIAKVQYQLEALNARCDIYCFQQRVDWFGKLMERPYVTGHADLVHALCGPPRKMAQQYCYRR